MDLGLSVVGAARMAGAMHQCSLKTSYQDLTGASSASHGNEYPDAQLQGTCLLTMLLGMRSAGTIEELPVSDDMEGSDRLITRREISRWAGTRRETVTTWAARHPGFPEPEIRGGVEYFRLSQVLDWLEGRSVPERHRKSDDPRGVTYAERVRRAAQDGYRAPLADLDDSGSEGILTELFGEIAVRVCGAGPQSSYLCLLLSLGFLRHCAPSSWANIRDEVQQAQDEQRDPQWMLRAIAHGTDEALRVRGLPPGTLAGLEALEVEVLGDLTHVIRLCEDLGLSGFRAMRDRFEVWARTSSGVRFTPRAVVDLIVELFRGDPPRRVHDPYMRGGELLVGMSASERTFVLSGASYSDDMLRLAGMSLAMSGCRALLSTGSDCPWTGTAGPQADFVLTNPPFNNRTERGPRLDQDWIFGPPPAHNDNYAWLQHILVSLKPGGRAGVLMPNKAAVSADDKEEFIRRRMIEEGAVEFVVALPRQLFATTAVGVMLWGLRSPGETSGDVLLIDARSSGEKSGKRRILSPGTIHDIESCLSAWKEGREDFVIRMKQPGRAVAASRGEICKQDYSLDPGDYLTDRATPGHPGRVALVVPNYSVLQGRIEDARKADERTTGVTLASRAPRESRLPGGWTEVRLNQLCAIQAGPSHERVKSVKRVAEGVALVLPRHLRGRRIVAHDLEYLASTTARSMERFLLKENDILIVRTGSVGPVALVTATEEGWLPDTNLLRLRCHDDVDPGYLLAFLSSGAAQPWIKTRSDSATAIPSISSKTLGRLLVPLPPLVEQRLVGGHLRDMDQQIAAHRSLVDAVEDRRAALADQLITGQLTIDTRLREDEQ